MSPRSASSVPPDLRADEDVLRRALCDGCAMRYARAAASVLGVAACAGVDRWTLGTRATPAEKQRPLPGDGLVVDPMWQATRATTICASFSAAWSSPRARCARGSSVPCCARDSARLLMPLNIVLFLNGRRRAAGDRGGGGDGRVELLPARLTMARLTMVRLANRASRVLGCKPIAKPTRSTSLGSVGLSLRCRSSRSVSNSSRQTGSSRSAASATTRSTPTS